MMRWGIPPVPFFNRVQIEIGIVLCMGRQTSVSLGVVHASVSSVPARFPGIKWTFNIFAGFLLTLIAL